MLDLLLATLIAVHEDPFQRNDMSAVTAVPSLASAVVVPIQTIGQQIDAINTLQLEIKALTAKAEAIQKTVDLKLEVLLVAMDKEGVDASKGKGGKAEVGEEVFPKVEEWDAFWAYIRRNNAFELLQKRPAVLAWRELASRRKDKTVPGTVPFIKRKVTVKAI